jgi:membrane associated rhomboid family serine protease
MIPFKDENPAELRPYITVALILANVAVWVFVQGMGVNLQASVCEFGLIPVEVTGKMPQGPEVCRLGGLTWGAVFTSMFMHGGWLHLVSNMMFLWVFGNNVEDSMGHVRFVIFYLLCGVSATLAHIGFHPSSALPTVGASGAISGVLGAYIVLYPQVRVHVFFPPFWILPMRAWVVLGYWIAIQLFMGLADIGGAVGGVAVWAHIGGFFVGLALVKLFERRQLVEAKREGRRLDRDEIRSRHYWW